MYADAYLAQTDGAYSAACGRRVPSRQKPQAPSMTSGLLRRTGSRPCSRPAGRLSVLVFGSVRCGGLTLGNVAAAKRGMEGIQSCVKIAMKKKVPKDVYASCLLAGYVGAVLLHLPTDGMPAFGEYSRMLPEGLRLFATYVMAHHTYLNGEIWSAYGMGKAALFMAERSYPISMTYIHCMMAVCAINRKHKQEAQEEMLRSWELAKMDGFLEPFIEHHGLLRGLIEACIRNRDPEAYQRITEGVISFSRGWMALHNPENRRKVTGELSTMEFSIAMLASGGWTNKEIGEHLGISINTVKHYLTDIFCKLNVKKRDELKKFMLK